MEFLNQYLLILLCLGLGTMFFSGRGVDFIAGFNALSPEEKSRYNKQALGKGVGILFFCAAVGGGLNIWFTNNSQPELADLMTPIMAIIAFTIACLYYFTRIFKNQ